MLTFLLSSTLLNHIGLNSRDCKSIGNTSRRRLKSVGKKNKRNHSDQVTSDSISSSPTTPTSTTPASSSSSSASAVSSISPGNPLRARVDSRESSASSNNNNITNQVTANTPPDAISAPTRVSYVAPTSGSSSIADYGDYVSFQHANYQQQTLGQSNSSYHDITQLTSTSSPAVVPHSTATTASGQSSASFVANTNTNSTSNNNSTNTNSSNSSRSNNNNTNTASESSEGTTGYTQFQQQTSGPDLTSLDTHLANNAAPEVTTHHQHQFTPTFANHHHQQDLQQQAVDQLTIGYQTSKTTNGTPSVADPLGAQHLQQPIHQSQQQQQQHYNQHQNQQSDQYNSLTSAMQQHNHHHQLMIEQHYVNAIAANGEQQARSSGSPSAQNLMSSISKYNYIYILNKY